MSALQEVKKAMGPGPATYPKGTLERVPGKQNWVDRVGGLPRYIERIASHLHYEKGKSIGHSIAIAVNAVKKMCAMGDLNYRGKQNVNAGSRAAACNAVAQWERKKAQARVSKGELGRKWSDKEMVQHIIKTVGDCDGGDECNCKKKKRVKKSRVPADMYINTGGKPKRKGFDPLQRRGKKGKWKGKPGTRVWDEEKKKWVSVSKSEVDISDAEFEELLSEVEEFLDPDDPDTQDFTVEGEIEKRDDEKQMVFGWCSIAKDKDGNEIVDKQGDVLDDIDQMENVAYDFVLHSRDGGEMHVRKGVSTLVESFVSTPEKWEAMGIPEGTLPIGWWVGFKVNDQKVWQDVKIGKYRMFSVHGSGTRKAYEDGES